MPRALNPCQIVWLARLVAYLVLPAWPPHEPHPRHYLAFHDAKGQKFSREEPSQTKMLEYTMNMVDTTESLHTSNSTISHPYRRGRMKSFSGYLRLIKCLRRRFFGEPFLSDGQELGGNR